MSETIVLDPNEETDRFEIDITPYIGGAGPDFGEAAIEAYFADADLGQVPIAHTIPNRVVTIPLNVLTLGGLTFDQLRSMLQAKVGLWQREGGVIKRETSIGPVYADVVDARLKLGGSTAQAMQDVDVDAVLTLECIPDWYGDELDLASETGTGEVIRLLAPERGDHPGRVRIVVSDASGVSQLGLLWGIRSRHYDSAVTAALSYEAEALTPLDAAAIATAMLPGASGGGTDNIVTHDNLGANWTPVLSTDLAGIGPLTHTGSYRVYVRAHTTSNPPPRIRLAWDVGDLTNPVTNTPVSPAGANGFYVIDLGEVRLDPAPVGTHRWRGQIQAVGVDGGENISIDRVRLQPLDEYAGLLRAPMRNEPGLVDYVCRDEFNQSGDLDGSALPAGGTWATSGSTGDFQTSGDGTLSRSTTLDDSPRVALAGTSVLAATAATLDISATADAEKAVVVRYVDANNFVRVTRTEAAGGAMVIAVVLTEGGSPVSVFSGSARGLAVSTVSVLFDTAGNFYVWTYPPGSSPGDPVVVGQDDLLADGGALEDGHVGIWDYSGFTAGTRTYDNFAAWVPDRDAVIHPNRALEIRTDGVYRENPDGDGYGPVWAAGDLPRLPSPGLEAREVELLVATSRGDLNQLPDPSPDDSLDVQVLYRPSYLYVPDGGPGS